jgi:hypothetical protein
MKISNPISGFIRAQQDSDAADLRINQVGVLTDRIAQSQLSLQLKLHQGRLAVGGPAIATKLLDASLKSVLVGTPHGGPPQPPMKTVRIPMLPCTSWNAPPRGINDLKHVFSKESMARVCDVRV